MKIYSEAFYVLQMFSRSAAVDNQTSTHKELINQIQA